MIDSYFGIANISITHIKKIIVVGRLLTQFLPDVRPFSKFLSELYWWNKYSLGPYCINFRVIYGTVPPLSLSPFWAAPTRTVSPGMFEWGWSKRGLGVLHQEKKNQRVLNLSAQKMAYLNWNDGKIWNIFPFTLPTRPWPCGAEWGVWTTPLPPPPIPPGWNPHSCSRLHCPSSRFADPWEWDSHYFFPHLGPTVVGWLTGIFVLKFAIFKVHFSPKKICNEEIGYILIFT